VFVAGADGCRGGWILFRVEVPSRCTSIETVDLRSVLRRRPEGLECVAIDIPIGLLDGPRACDLAARVMLGQPRGCSVFPTPCRAAVQAASYAEACEANLARTGRRISRQAWRITAKIREVDEALTSAHQAWAFEIHPEVCF
jgi:predicted RNase H-like nuclease